MSDSDTTTTETDTTDVQDRNWRALEAERDRYKAEADTLRPLAREKVLREAGFDPDSGEGKALVQLIGDESDPAKIVEKAAEFGWTPKPTMSAQETATVAASQAQDALRAVAMPDVPVGDVDRQIQEAREQGNWELAVVLENRKLYGAKTG